MNLESIDTKTLVEIHNHFSKIAVTKFRDRKTAENRVLSLMVGKEQQLSEYLTANNVGEPVVAEIAKLLESREQARIKAESKTVETSQPKSTINQPDQVFKAIRDLLRDADLGETNVADLNSRINLGFPRLKKICEQLQNAELVVVTDDGSDGYFYLGLTKKGMAFEGEVVLKAKEPKAKEPKAKEPKAKEPKAKEPKAKEPKAKEPSSRSRVSKDARIYKLVDKNPRRKDTHGYNSFAKIRNGMTVEQYQNAGGRMNDLAWDLDHEFVELREA